MTFEVMSRSVGAGSFPLVSRTSQNIYIWYIFWVAMHPRDVDFYSHSRFAVEALNLLDVSLKDSVG